MRPGQHCTIMQCVLCSLCNCNFVLLMFNHWMYCWGSDGCVREADANIPTAIIIISLLKPHLSAMLQYCSSAQRWHKGKHLVPQYLPWSAIPQFLLHKFVFCKIVICNYLTCKPTVNFSFLNTTVLLSKWQSCAHPHHHYPALVKPQQCTNIAKLWFSSSPCLSRLK